MGINRPIQQDLYKPYVDHYFEIVKEFCAKNSYEVSMQFAVMAFPRFATTSETLAKAEKWIADNKDASDGVIRWIKEGRDSIKRALKAQAAV